MPGSLYHPDRSQSSVAASCTKFGNNIGQSSALYSFVLDFRYIAPFRNENDSIALWSKIKAGFRIFAPV